VLSQIILNITKKTVWVVGLIWAAEYGMLSLIEDSPEILKAATVVCALVGLVLVEAWDHARHRHFWVLVASSVVIGGIYLGFVTYALFGVLHRHDVQSGLRRIYSESTPLVLMPVDNGTKIVDFAAAYKNWEEKSADWIAVNVGPVAHDQFLSRSQPTAFAGQGYVNARGTMFHWADCGTSEYECYRSRLEMDRANLLAILGNEKYAE
jgi:hypothetical protein